MKIDEGSRNSTFLTDNRVAKLRPQATPYRVFDSSVQGFHVRVFPSGTRSFGVQFQRAKAKVSATIGQASAWDTEKARERARELRQLFDDGRDVKAFLQEKREGKTLDDLVATWREDYSGNLRPLTLKGYNSVLKVIQGRLGKRLVKDLDYPTIHKFFLARKRTAPIQANRCVAMLSKLMNIAEKEGLRPFGSNPCRLVEKTREVPRDRVLSVEELHVLEQTLQRLVEVGIPITRRTSRKAMPLSQAQKSEQPMSKMDPLMADLVRLIAFSGLRRGEALGLRWADIDEGANVMRFAPEAHKGGNRGAKSLPLNSAIREVLSRRAAIKLSPFVFPGEDGPFKGEGKWLDRIIKETGLGRWSAHDLRRTFNSTCAGLGFPPQAFDLLLGHALGGVRDTYTVMGAGIGLLAQASEDTALWIKAAMEGRNPTPGQKIVPPETSRKGQA